MQGEITANGLIIGGMIGQRGAPGNGIASIVKTGESGLVDTYTITYTNGTTDTIQVTNGAKGDKGDKGDQGIQGIQGVKGDKGDKGDTGEQGMQGIQGERGEKGEQGERGERGYQGVTGEKGDKGDKGDTGAKGDTGETGNGISSIEKTSTTGNIDTYTITFTNGTTTTFEVTNGANGSVTDVQVEGTSVVDNGVANITGLATQNELDYYKTIYNVLPKVNGNGERITLDNTGESILKLNPRGQCKQDSTTGKNLMPFTNQDFTLKNVRYYVENGNLYLNGTSTGETSSLDSAFKTNFSFTLPAGTYTLSHKTGIIQLYLYKYEDNTNIITLPYNTASQTFTLTEETKLFIGIYVYQKTFTNESMEIMISTSGGDYEPFTYGASPNPSYPQEIHEGSGDNEINVEGKNLFSGYTKGIGLNGTTGVEIADANAATSEFIPLKVRDDNKYRIWGLPTTISTFVAGYNKDKQFLGRTGGVTTGYFILQPNQFVGGTPQGTGDIEFVRVHTYKISTSAGTINDIDNAKVMLEAGTTATTYEPYNGDTYELSLGDIKMRGIGTYEDYFVRSSGKNMFDISATPNRVGGDTTYSVTGNTLHVTGNWFVAYLIDVEENTDYYVSADKKIVSGSSAGNVAIYSANMQTAITWGSIANFTFNSGSNTQVNVVLYSGSGSSGEVYFSNIQLEKGKLETPYEPFGSGQWCKYNSIGEEVLDGSTTGWNFNGSTSTYKQFIRPFNNKMYGKANLITSTFKVDGGLYYAVGRDNSSNISFNVGLNDCENTEASFQTWLSTHNTQVDYVLASPYLSLIENETLISQLDKIEKALAKSGQTNISQVNNDAPFKIYASALMKISGE